MSLLQLTLANNHLKIIYFPIASLRLLLGVDLIEVDLN